MFILFHINFLRAMILKENQRFKEFRKRLGMTQVEIAYILGVKHSTISQIETAKLPVSKRIKHSLERELSLSKEWLEAGKGDPLLPEAKTYRTSDRLGKVINYYNLSLQEFCKKTGVDEPEKVVATIARGTEPSPDIINKTLLAFPDVRPEWLIKGKGKMIRDNNTEATGLYRELYEAYKRKVEFLEKKVEQLEGVIRKKEQ